MFFANDPDVRSWLDVPEDSDFPIQNIPFGIYRNKEGDATPACRIGDHVIDLSHGVQGVYFTVTHGGEGGHRHVEGVHERPALQPDKPQAAQYQNGQQAGAQLQDFAKSQHTNREGDTPVG